MKIIAAPLLLGLLAACSPQPSAEATPGPEPLTLSPTKRPDVHPESGLRIIDLSVDTGDQKIGFAVELADTPEAQNRGLMFRTELDDFAGMIFPSDPPQVRSFWMKHTSIPLSIAFIDKLGRVVHLAELKPNETKPVSSEVPAMYALEMRAGWFAERAVGIGQPISGLPVPAR